MGSGLFVENFDDFKEECLKNLNFIRTLTRMSDQKIDIKTLYEKKDEIKQTIKDRNLNIKYKETPKFSLIYEEKKFKKFSEYLEIVILSLQLIKKKELMI